MIFCCCSIVKSDFLDGDEKLTKKQTLTTGGGHQVQPAVKNQNLEMISFKRVTKIQTKSNYNKFYFHNNYTKTKKND